MKYNSNFHIESYKDVVFFAKHLAEKQKMSFHPYDDFSYYFKEKDTIALYNMLNEECFLVCEKLNFDLYQIHYDF